MELSEEVSMGGGGVAARQRRSLSEEFRRACFVGYHYELPSVWPQTSSDHRGAADSSLDTMHQVSCGAFHCWGSTLTILLDGHNTTRLRGGTFSMSLIAAAVVAWLVD